MSTHAVLSQPPAAERTLYMRPLPPSMAPLDSAAGRAMFRRALLEGTLEGYFRLAQQFHTQADPAYCGLGTLVCALNALGIDPGRRWKGSWRWFSEELLDCCKALDAVRRSGITLDDAACLARCNGASVTVRRARRANAVAFRNDLLAATTASNGPVLVANYARRVVGQTGDRPLLADRRVRRGHRSSARARHCPLQVSGALAARGAIVRGDARA